MLKSRYEKPNLVSSGPNQQAHYYKLSFCPSVHLCICPSLQNYLYGIQPIVSPFSQSGSYLTYRVPLGKECAVIFNRVLSLRLKLYQMCRISLSGRYFLFSLTQSCSYFTYIVLLVRGYAVTLSKVKGQGHIRPSMKNPCPMSRSYVLFPLLYLGHT